MRRTRVANFADIIKILTMFTKKIFIESKKNQKNLRIKMQSISVFSDIEKLADFCRKNGDASRNNGLSHMIHIFFESYLSKV